MINDWQLFFDKLSDHAAQLTALLLQNPEIVSIPIAITLTVVISILWAEKVPSIPIHFDNFRLILGNPSIKKWQRSIVANNIELTLDKSLSHSGELLSYLGQESMAKHAEKTLKPHIEEYVDDIMATDFSIVWENLPPVMKRHAYQRALSGLPRFVDNLVDDIAYHSDHLLNYQQLAKELLEKHPLKLAPFFKADRFFMRHPILKRSACLGILFSLPVIVFQIYITAAANTIQAQPWVLMALLLFFEAIAVISAIYLAFFSVYSISLPSSLGQSKLRHWLKKWINRSPLIVNKTQIVEAHTHLITYQIFKLNQIVRHLFKGANTTVTYPLIRKHLHPLIETFFTKVIIQLFFGLSGFLRLKKQATEKIALLADYPFEDRIFQQDASQRLSTLITERLSQLSDVELSSLVTPYILYLRTKTILCAGTTITTMAAIQLYIFH